jgi:two-component system, OmpR family, response regulator MtrA
MNPLAVIVEDDEKLAVIFNEAVKQAGYSTTILRDGAAAMQELFHMQPNLVVLDLHLPQVSGETILTTMRQDARFANTWVILATADQNLANKLESHSDLVLLKPISFTQLRDLAIRLRRTRIHSNPS